MTGLADRYRIIEARSHGETASVFRAQDIRLERPVAIKLLNEKVAQAPENRDVITREARYLSLLDHPNVIPLYDYLDSERGPILVMRYAERHAGSLYDAGQFVARSEEVLRVGRQVADALDHCADRGIAHRDVKPANILLGAAGQAYLTDFGIAALFDDERKWKSICGSKPFLGPEMLINRPADNGTAAERSRSDQFALGVTLYQLLTGKLPHQDRPATRNPDWDLCTAYRLLNGEQIVPCSERDPTISSRVDEVFQQIFDLNPDKRYGSNREAVDALARALLGRVRGRRIFCSFSHHDKKLVGALVAELRALGADVWWDKDIRYGEDWDDAVERAMADSDLMLVVVSGHSSLSSEVKNEWRYWVYELKKPIIPLLIENCRLPYRLYSKHHIVADNRDPKALAGEITEVMSRMLSYVASESVASPLAASVTQTMEPSEGTAPNIGRIEVAIQPSVPLLDAATHGLLPAASKLDEYRELVG